jgi:GntR family transcriptional repressor for pyruvate dehydrogenase complex
MEQGSGNSLSDMIRVEQERALDVIEVRKCMESWTAYFAAKHALPEDLRRMEEIIDGMRQNLETLQPSEDLDANFHVVVARATHNVVWLHLMQNIFDAMKEFQRGVWRAVYLKDEDQKELFSHHQGVYQAIKNRDAEQARILMLEHLGFAEERSNLYLKKIKEGL